MRHLLALACLPFVALVLWAPAARADDAGARVVRRGTSGPVTAPTIPSGRVYEGRRAPLGPPVEKDWRVFVGAYMWGSSISGDAYDEGFDTDIDVPFKDIFSQLRYAFQGYFEVGYRRWSFAIDASFIGLGKGLAERNGFYPSLDLDQTTVAFVFGYTFLCRPLGIDDWCGCLYARRLTVDALVGTRYWNIKQELEVISAGNPPVDRTSRESWWDPIVGARMQVPFAKRWGVNLRADIGGFGVGSDLTWQVQALLYYRVTRQLRLGLGYRALYVDRVTGTGTTREGIEATFHGPMLGLGFEF